ncbi:MAG: cell wall metabolism sensor histidine kinase WalK [Bacteroidia bacterium]|nr:cell wall metabolism sensor histidine kinase WalK [Bacteroidia bacterium]
MHFRFSYWQPGILAGIFGTILFWLIPFPWIAAILFVSISGFLFAYWHKKIIEQPLRDLLDRIKQLKPINGNGPPPDFEELIPTLYKVVLDITRQNRQEIEKLQEIEVFRRAFIGDISHELRTPIFAIQGFLETLLDGALENPTVNKKFLKRALSNADRLMNLVQDLLTLTQLEAGEMEMKLEPFKIHHLALEVIDLLDYKLTKKGRNMTISYSANQQEDTLVLADRERIKQVLINLIENAIKYGKPDGYIKVCLHRHNGTIWVRVEDNGIGISQEDLPNIFDRFYRADKSRSREGGGTGLGLSIVKRLLEAHQQEIRVSSELSVGTVFEFSLPVVSATAETF